MSKNCQESLPPHIWTVWLEELLGVVAEVLHHLLLPELLHLPAGRALVLLALPAGGINLSQELLLDGQTLRDKVLLLRQEGSEKIGIQYEGLSEN